MQFNKIDLEEYERKEHFLHYLNNVPCTYSMTTNIDITELIKYIHKKSFKLYPILIYTITNLANKHIEFRMSLDSEGNLGYFSKVDPTYTIFHKENNTFSSIWTKYYDDFQKFYNEYEKDIKEYGTKKGFITKASNEENLINISAIPWNSFSSFNLNLPKSNKYLLPIFTIGKYFKQDERMILPLAVQVHHAVCDGFHASRFINELQEMLINYEKWI